MKKHIYISILLVALAQGAIAQKNTSLYFMETVPQSISLNPALQPRANSFIAVPATNIFIDLETNITVKNLLQKKGNNWVTPIDNDFDYSTLHKVFKNGARINTDINSEIANFGWRSKNGYWSFGIKERVDANITLPSAIFKIVDNGLPSGTQLDFTNLNVSFNAFHEISAAYSHKLTENLTIGARAKYLSGIMGVKTEISKFNIETSRDLWDVNVDAQMHVSMPIDFKENEKGEVDLDSLDLGDMPKKDIVKRLIPSFKNPGLGFDFGAEYTINDNFKVAASVTDLGFILWSNSHALDLKGAYSYDGIDVEIRDFDNVDFNEALTELTDSLKSCVSATIKKSSFATSLYPNIYIGGEYTPNHFLSIGLLSHSSIVKKRFIQDFSLSVNLKPYKMYSVVLGFNANTKGYCSANTGFSVNFGALQFYLMADYIPINYQKIKVKEDKLILPHSCTDLNLSFGFNILMGQKGYKDKTMLNTQSSI